MGWMHVLGIFPFLAPPMQGLNRSLGLAPNLPFIGAPVKPEEVVVNKTLGIVLIGLGLLGLIWGGFTYTTSEKVVDIGPIHATREKTHNVPLPPIIGAVALVAGVVLMISSGKN